jgi:hyperosmotically inducible protein
MLNISKFLICLVSVFLIPLVGFGDDTNQPDNSKMNERDRVESTVNAQDQGTSKADVELTRKIRQAVVKQKSLSADAQNIKIITINGMVTLKGPVKSMTEKNQIEKIANGIAGAPKVASQIEVEK